ncbi:unnamed protein product [Pleuronectes platessa]|uniref:Uncharacterized protein n=1 Tax=Pleuronectes platessa TaxID=8262 RepID=A0A9N7TW72_PLEPL|nr:unnamed protein product [Pleuronectes platessa]
MKLDHVTPRDDGYISLLAAVDDEDGGDDDDDDDEEGGWDLAVCRLRSPSNLRRPSSRISLQKTAHDEDPYSGLEAASFSGEHGACHRITGENDIFGRDVHAGLSPPPQSQQGLHVPDVKNKKKRRRRRMKRRKRRKRRRWRFTTRSCPGSQELETATKRLNDGRSWRTV